MWAGGESRMPHDHCCGMQIQGPTLLGTKMSCCCPQAMLLGVVTCLVSSPSRTGHAQVVESSATAPW